MTHEELHEWARVNLLPHENAETQLRFAEGEERYDEDYILEKYNENEHLNMEYESFNDAPYGEDN
ncbi:MAG: hypothetical protein H8E55_08970 [Pelagibacterales bacterium]|nr:hypothetical protein [Pelagibacterales bacterium]